MELVAALQLQSKETVNVRKGRSDRIVCSVPCVARVSPPLVSPSKENKHHGNQNVCVKNDLIKSSMIII